ncbi:hypothetical protein CR513_19103, partial [Mucuna pruriens]
MFQKICGRWQTLRQPTSYNANDFLLGILWHEANFIGMDLKEAKGKRILSIYRSHVRENRYETHISLRNTHSWRSSSRPPERPLSEKKYVESGSIQEKHCKNTGSGSIACVQLVHSIRSVSNY